MTDEINTLASEPTLILNNPIKLINFNSNIFLALNIKQFWLKLKIKLTSWSAILMV